MAFFVFFVSNLSLTLFACLITALIAPAATGSGIPEVKAYLNGVDEPGIFTVRTLFVKVFAFVLSFIDITIGTSQRGVNLATFSGSQ